MGKFVVFEGPDSVGKGTLSKALAAQLAGEGRKVIRVEPTKESHPRGRKMIYGMLESGAAKRWPNIFQFVQFLNRMYFQLFKLPKLLRDYDLVILDRWSLSGYVYGRCEGINSALNDFMYRCAKEADVVLVLGGKSYRRAAADDSYERDTVLQKAVKHEYLLAAWERPQHEYVYNDAPIEELLEDIRALLRESDIIS